MKSLRLPLDCANSKYCNVYIEGLSVGNLQQTNTVWLVLKLSNVILRYHVLYSVADQMEMIFYNKTLYSSNIVLRVMCTLHSYEDRKLLFSVYRVHQGIPAMSTSRGPSGIIFQV